MEQQVHLLRPYKCQLGLSWILVIICILRTELIIELCTGLMVLHLELSSPALQVYRLVERIFVSRSVVGSPGSTTTQLASPSGLVRNATTGDLYIADTSNHRIVYWLSGATSGTVVAGGNGAGTGSTQLFSPYSLAFDAVTNSLIIVNYSAHTVVRWVLGATSWTLLAGVTGTSGSTSTLLSNPLSVVLDPYGNMYVSDTQNHRIQFFPFGQSNGTTIAGTTGSWGANASQLRLPYWAIVDSQLNLYVADTYNNRIQKFFRY